MGIHEICHICDGLIFCSSYALGRINHNYSPVFGEQVHEDMSVQQAIMDRARDEVVFVVRRRHGGEPTSGGAHAHKADNARLARAECGRAPTPLHVPQTRLLLQNHDNRASEE
eukprot:6190318-Pleurochrysis_carterae.AAC.2